MIGNIIHDELCYINMILAVIILTGGCNFNLKGVKYPTTCRHRVCASQKLITQGVGYEPESGRIILHTNAAQPIQNKGFFSDRHHDHYINRISNVIEKLIY
jgi:hypothetical protein